MLAASVDRQGHTENHWVAASGHDATPSISGCSLFSSKCFGATVFICVCLWSPPSVAMRQHESSVAARVPSLASWGEQMTVWVPGTTLFMNGCLLHLRRDWAPAEHLCGRALSSGAAGHVGHQLALASLCGTSVPLQKGARWFLWIPVAAELVNPGARPNRQFGFFHGSIFAPWPPESCTGSCRLSQMPSRIEESLLGA